MAALNKSRIAKDMISATSGVFKDKWPDAKDYAESEARKLAESLSMVAKGVAKGTISKRAGKALLAIHKNSAKAVLLTVEGLGLLMVEDAINAAIKVIRDAVNTAAGGVKLI